MQTISFGGKSHSGALREIGEAGSQALDKRAEVAFVKDLVSNCWEQLQSFRRIDYAKWGFDIEIVGDERTITIELKASSYKSDYFNQNGASDYLYGNCLKFKDIDLAKGLIRADFLLFAAEMNSGFDFWLFSRDDLANLFPRSPTFIPSFVPTLMIEAPNRGAAYGSHLNDDFNLFKKGVICVILPTYDEGSQHWTSTYPKGKYHSFLETWCPLIDEEYEELNRMIQSKLANRYNRNEIFTFVNKIEKNPNFRTRHCKYRSETTNPKCLRCKSIIGALTKL